MQNISAPPKTHSSAIENHRSPKESERKKKPISRGGIAFMLGGGTLMATCVALVIVIRNRSCAQKLKRLGSGNSSLQSIPVTTARGKLSILLFTIIYTDKSCEDLCINKY